MKPLKIVILFFFIFQIYACTKDRSSYTIAQTQSVEIKGIIAKQGITSYQYGTHTLSASREKYALKSSVVNLDQYVNQSVTVKGNKVRGYPIEGGPDYIDVLEVK